VKSRSLSGFFVPEPVLLSVPKFMTPPQCTEKNDVIDCTQTQQGQNGHCLRTDH
jgi:hypothetical protein